MKRTTVCKFGGSSLADASCFRRVRDILREDRDRRYIVVSAPGRRTSSDDKLTDLFCRWQASEAPEERDRRKAVIRERLLEIVRGLRLSLDVDHELKAVENNLGLGLAYAASRGEFLCAKIMAEFLGVPFLDARGLVCFSEDGELEAEKTCRKLRKALEGLDRAVIPGFYGSGPRGEIRTFSRGGSDVTGALVARAADASLYENWTDVPGFMSLDPRLSSDARCAGELSYVQLRLLSIAGAAVMHPDAIPPVAEADIPTLLRDTFLPRAAGTMISNGGNASIPCLAGKGGLVAVELPNRLRSDELEPLGDSLYTCHGVTRLILPGERAEALSALPENKYPRGHISIERDIFMVALAEPEGLDGLPAIEETSRALGCEVLAMEAFPTWHSRLFLLRGKDCDSLMRRAHEALIQR